jgi:RNA-directed DNA polymerase
MDTALPMYEWKDLPWRKFEREVFKLQKRIYQASRRGNIKSVHKLQRLLINSWSAKCLAVRRVTQDNQGKHTAGMDGVKSLPPTKRLELVKQLKLDAEAQPVRRVWIPKRGTDEKRPLGIATLYDRALQTLVRFALEPEWEAKFEPNSYGFRPGRSCHDAIVAIHLSINKLPKYVLDADIAKCFDRINRQQLMEKLSTYPALRRLIRSWINVGIMDGNELFPTETGLPQGGPISPLLANIALHGLETAITAAFPQSKRRKGKRENWQPTVVRYADDLVVLHRDLAVVEEIQQITSDWLAQMGLELKPSKTRITHTLIKHNEMVGFDFLGFTVRQFPVGKSHSGKNTRKALLGFKTLTKPSQEAIRRHSQVLKDEIRRHKYAPQAALIARLNPIIRGWTNYYATGASKKTFADMQRLTFLKLRRWAKRRHPNVSWKKVTRWYWRLERGRWDFATKEGIQLFAHSRTPIQRYTKVRGSKSPYDGDWVYWASRLGRHPDLPKRVAILLHRQKGKCSWCGLYFEMEDSPEVDHIHPKSQGGKDRYDNWQLLHKHCHDEKTAKDNVDASAVLGTRNKSQSAEEPDAGKLACPVLKPSGGGDSFA